MTRYPRGFAAGAVACGVKTGTPDRLDVAVIASDTPCVAAAVYTKNQVVAAPLAVTRRHLAAARPRAIVVNSGNANACTGEQGERDAEAMAVAAAKLVGSRADEVIVASTGVIGVPLPVDRIVGGVTRIQLSSEGWPDVERATMTTDTQPKRASMPIARDEHPVLLHGVAKGAGMIHPDVATMLGFIVTDAVLEAEEARACLREAVDESFNAISIDGDTSTNDMVVLLANGRSGRATTDAFRDALTRLCVDLAKQIVADGEGATKVFEMVVKGARSRDDARAAARTIASSNLVKAAIHGADPNWGRVLAAAGRSGAQVDDRRATVRIGGHAVFERGVPCRYDTDAVRHVLRQPEMTLELDLALGQGTGRAWGCDLSAEYVRINAEYTT